jgi:NADH-ubiquinone oxidoreductase chain 4
MLSYLIIIPRTRIIILRPIQNKNKIKRIRLIRIIRNFIVSIILWINFDINTNEYQFTQEFIVQFTNIYIRWGVDGVSIIFLILTTFIIPICILSIWNNIINNLKFFLICFLILEIILIIVFIVLDIILFYIFFESVLIPLFLIIGIWGNSHNSIRAAFLLFIYTLFGSLFILLRFIYIYSIIGTTNYIYIRESEINIESQKIIWLAIFISIAIKTPLIPFHIWLPRAHAEAPLAGSIILAGLILKLATYGYIRILINFLPEASNYFSPLIQTIRIITLIYTSLVTLRQTDFKALVAYSSISHISIVVIRLFSNTIQGFDGSIIISIAHGVVSPALFILVGGILYDRYHTRTIRYYRGITIYIPIFSRLFFIFTIFNAAVPLSRNFIGEFLCLSGTFQRNPIFAIISRITIVLSAIYSIWLYNRIAFGNWSKYLNYTTDLNRREFILLIPLLFIRVLFGIYPNIILNTIHASTSILIYI